MEIDEYVDNLMQIKEYFHNLSQIVKKVNSILDTVAAFQQNSLPQSPVLNLELSDEYILDHIIEYPELMQVSSYLENLRQVLIENLGIWHVVNQKWIDDLQRFIGKDSHNLEVMCGNAIISANLQNTIATDNLDWKNQDNQKPHPWCQVEQLDAMQAVKKYYAHVDNIIMSWAPDCGESDYEILCYLRKVKFKGNLIVIGERNGATNSKKFWQKAKLELNSQLNLHHRPFDFIKDKVWLVK